MDLRKLPYLVRARRGAGHGALRGLDPPDRAAAAAVRITLSTAAAKSGAYYMFAREYRKLAGADGFAVEIQTGAGSVETLKRLASGQSMTGFVQGGTAEAAPTAGLLSLGSLYYEPVWLVPPEEPAAERA